MAGLMDEVNRTVGKVQEGVKELLDKTDIDEKIVAAAKDIKGKAEEAIEKARPGVEEALGKAGAGARELIDKGVAAINRPETKDAMDHIHDQVAEQVEKIRAAASGTDPIHDFFNKKPAETEEKGEDAQE